MAVAVPSGCPLCRSEHVRFFARAHARTYYECDACRLVYLAPDERLDPAAEREHYGTHENDPADAGYRGFLSRVATPLTERLAAGSVGLDYGSGPGPTLSLMLREQGFPVECYDPFFAPERAVLRRSYDFITCTEVAEHFYFPADEFDGLAGLLRPGGWLALMTEMLQDERSFQHWRYARDPTHVCFYRRSTMEWIGAHYAWSAEFPHPNVVLFQKPCDSDLRPSHD